MPRRSPDRSRRIVSRSRWSARRCALRLRVRASRAGIAWKVSGSSGSASAPRRARSCSAWKLREELAPSLAHGVAQLAVVVGEEQERRRRRELLALKEQRRRRPEQRQRGQRPVASRRRHLVHALAERGVRDLIVVLEEVHEGAARQIERRGSRAASPARHTTGPETGSRTSRHETSSCGEPREVGVVRLAAAGERDERGVVVVVVQQRVDAVTALRAAAARASCPAARSRRRRRADGRRPRLARAARSPVSTCSGDASWTSCVASSRSPSK